MRAASRTRCGQRDWRASSAAAATAGGIRPPVDALQTRLGEQELLFGSWLGLLTAMRVASLAMEITETELLEDVLLTVGLDE